MAFRGAVEGVPSLVPSGLTFVLRPGDSVVFDSHIPYRTLNTGIIPLWAILWVNFQPAC